MISLLYVGCLYYDSCRATSEVQINKKQKGKQETKQTGKQKKTRKQKKQENKKNKERKQTRNKKDCLQLPVGKEASTSALNLLELQSHFGDNPVKFQVLCPQNGAAVLKGL